MSAEVAYLDSSAFVKLIVPEPETAALRRHLRGRRLRASAALLRTEGIRAVWRGAPRLLPAARRALRGFYILDVDTAMYDAAARLAPAEMRSLDAIHLAAALSLGDDLAELVSYDQRQVAAAVAHGLPVASPV
ncbi:MAG: type II toxin-antitoxin system VapC family toxin [Candidatus Dormibacteraeota bacterium]|nr:type II toxin-antitoxin system VapC family toxin [Candidatus Dormibacteraeota bacterium]